MLCYPFEVPYYLMKQILMLQIWGWTSRAWDWSKKLLYWFASSIHLVYWNVIFSKVYWLKYFWNNWQEGAEEDADNNNNEDIPDAIETAEKEQVPVERSRKTSKYMTKYERARILGTRALQIRFYFRNLSI